MARILGLGIDRQDYTKGIPHRLRAVERLFEKWPQYRGRLIFLQAGATRSDQHRLVHAANHRYRSHC